MLKENEIIHYLCTHLLNNGYEILQARGSIEKGVDVIAEHQQSGEHLHIAVKDETSSKLYSKRYGVPFSSAQTTNHVARAVLTAMKVVSNKEAKNIKAA